MLHFPNQIVQIIGNTGKSILNKYGTGLPVCCVLYSRSQRSDQGSLLVKSDPIQRKSSFSSCKIIHDYNIMNQESVKIAVKNCQCLFGVSVSDNEWAYSMELSPHWRILINLQFRQKWQQEDGRDDFVSVRAKSLSVFDFLRSQVSTGFSAKIWLCSTQSLSKRNLSHRTPYNL